MEYVHVCRYALIAGPLLAAACSVLSVFLVLRGMAMISEGVAHAGVGGMGVALLIGLVLPFMDTQGGWFVVTGIFCTITALVIGYVSRGKHVSEDSAIGIFLVASVSLGVCALYFRRFLHGSAGTPPSLEDILFGGSIASANLEDVYALIALVACVFGIVFSMYKAFVYTTLDEEMARINGVPVRMINVLLLLMVSVAISLGARMVGLFMISALIIIPGATARLMSRSFGRVLASSLVVGVGGVVGSLFMAVLFAMKPGLDRLPPGPIIVLTLFAIFMVVWAYRQVFKVKFRSNVAG